MKPTLVVMAAGMASRYGSLKQIEPVGRGGEIILEYSVYDAVRAGFGRAVFIVKEDFLDEFKALQGRKMSRHIDVDYVCQRQGDHVPEDVRVPASRVKPWGTGHAVLCVKDVVKEPFCVINADDFYGFAAFDAVGRFLRDAPGSKPYRCCMAGFRAGNTLSEFGTVSRGVCSVGADGRLSHVTEYMTLAPSGDAIIDRDTGDVIPYDAPVSMNVWGFPAGILHEYERFFLEFLREKDLEKNEFYMQDAVNALMEEKSATVDILPVENRWHGVTYRGDLEPFRRALSAMDGYPEKLWD